MLKIAIITGSTRPGRKSEAVARLQSRPINARSETQTTQCRELVDNRRSTFDLPALDSAFEEAMASFCHQLLNQYRRAQAGNGGGTRAKDAGVKPLSGTLPVVDAITPQFNHSTFRRPFDWSSRTRSHFLYREWNDKAAGVLSAMAGRRNPAALPSSICA